MKDKCFFCGAKLKEWHSYIYSKSYGLCCNNLVSLSKKMTNSELERFSLIYQLRKKAGIVMKTNCSRGKKYNAINKIIGCKD